MKKVSSECKWESRAWQSARITEIRPRREKWAGSPQLKNQNKLAQVAYRDEKRLRRGTGGGKAAPGRPRVQTQRVHKPINRKEKLTAVKRLMRSLVACVWLPEGGGGVPGGAYCAELEKRHKGALDWLFGHQKLRGSREKSNLARKKRRHPLETQIAREGTEKKAKETRSQCGGPGQLQNEAKAKHSGITGHALAKKKTRLHRE